MRGRLTSQTPTEARLQYGAVPFIADEIGRVRIALLTSRESRRWVIPKGWPIARLSGPEVAIRETNEEAGLTGVIATQEPAGFYTYPKRLPTGKNVLCRVEVYLLRVQAELDAWPEMAERVRAWFSPQIAATLVAERALAEILRGLTVSSTVLRS